MKLQGKKILVGVTGGIAAYKACEMVRLFQKLGAEVRVAMTPAATDFVGPMTFASLSGFAVYQAGPHSSNTFRHIDYPRWADLFVVAPASANSIARFAHGHADEPVSMCWAACLAPKIIVPAMNFAMYEAPANQRNLSILRGDGVHIVEPERGHLACGEEGRGRFPELQTIVATACEVLAQKKDSNPDAPIDSPPNAPIVLVTAGRTEEAIDPVRYISNRSSGKTGVALAKEFLQDGFRVILVHGPMEANIPKGCESISVRSAREMHAAVLERFPKVNAIVHCAAVADYRPREEALEKIKDSRSQVLLELEPNPNILRDTVARKQPKQIVVGFALETQDPLEHARTKLTKSGADLIIVNTPVRTQSGFGHDNVEYALVGHNLASEALQLGPKEELAQRVVRFIRDRLEFNHGN